MAEPPSETGAANAIVAWPLPGVALVIVGALLALIHYNYKPEAQPAVKAASPVDDEDEF